MPDPQEPIFNSAFDRLVQDTWHLARVLAFVEQTSTRREDLGLLKRQLGPTFAFIQRMALDALILGCAHLVDDSKGVLSMKKIVKVIPDVDNTIIAKCHKLADDASKLVEHRNNWIGHRNRNVVEGTVKLEPFNLAEVRNLLREAVEILRSISIPRGTDLPSLEQLTGETSSFGDGHTLLVVSREAGEREELRRRAWRLSYDPPQREDDSIVGVIEALKRQPTS